MSITLVFYPGVVHSVVAPISQGLNPLSTVLEIQWNDSSRISPLLSTEWNITAYGILKQVSADFNVLSRVHVTGPDEVYGIVRPIVWPIDYRDFVPSVAYNVLIRNVKATVRDTWKVSARISAKGRVRFNCNATLYAHTQVRFNALDRVYVPGWKEPSWSNEVDQPTTHPISYSAGQTSSYFEYNVAKRISNKVTSRFIVRDKTSRQLTVAFNDEDILVVCHIPSTWNTLERL